MNWWQFAKGFVDGMARLAPVGLAIIILLAFLSFCQNVHIQIHITQEPSSTGLGGKEK